MNSKRCFAPLLVLFAILGLVPHIGVAKPWKWEPIASFSSSPPGDADGTRALAILGEHEISSGACGSVGWTISVHDSQAIEARRLLAIAVKTEGLHISLIDNTSDGKSWNSVTPESILSPNR